jgi:phosphoribosylformylglycinamidine synthase
MNPFTSSKPIDDDDSSIIQDKALIMSGYGINSDAETQSALLRAGMEADIVHVNDLISGRYKLSDYRLLVFPGGFSYGDDTGAGNAYANRVRNNLWDDLTRFLEEDNLVLGICNGFQILANLGLVPAFDRRYERSVALVPSQKGVLECRYVTIKPASTSLWTEGIEKIVCPVSHGQGNFFCSKEVLSELKRRKMIAFTYCRDDLSPADGQYPFNPNGSIADIAGITSADGKVLAMMPHPERAMDFVNEYDWPLQKERLLRQQLPVPKESANMKIFRNIVGYFR